MNLRSPFRHHECLGVPSPMHTLHRSPCIAHPASLHLGRCLYDEKKQNDPAFSKLFKGGHPFTDRSNHSAQSGQLAPLYFSNRKLEMYQKKKNSPAGNPFLCLKRPPSPAAPSSRPRNSPGVHSQSPTANQSSVCIPAHGGARGNKAGRKSYPRARKAYFAPLRGTNWASVFGRSGKPGFFLPETKQPRLFPLVDALGWPIFTGTQYESSTIILALFMTEVYGESGPNYQISRL